VRANLRDSFARDRGLTLVEVVLALALLGFLASATYLFFAAGSGLLIGSATSYRLQREAALAAEFIVQEVRNASELELLDGPPAQPEQGYRYLYCDPGARAVARVDEGGGVVRRGAGVIEGLSFRIVRTQDGGRNLLRFRVATASGGQAHELTSEVLLNNLSGKEPSEEKPGVKYKLPP